MLSSNSSCNHNPYTNYRPPFPENDITSSSISKLEDPYSSSFSFSFPNSPHMHLEYEDVYLQFLELFYHEQQSITTAAADHEINITAAKMADSKENAAAVNEDATAAAAPPPELQGNGKPTNTISSKANHHHHQQQLSSNVIRKRCSKKDRHSKINTARGPRDRRMRLSLDIARKFFDLQDLLGFDKASRTVEWLLRKSSPAIRDLARGRGRGGESLINDDGADHHHHVMLNNNPSSESSTCEDNCEVVSSTVEEAAAAVAAAAASNKTRRSKKIRKVGHRTTVARESRRKARERARERTSQKKRLLIISEEAAKAKLCGESVGLTHTSFKENDPIHHVHVQPPVEDLSSDEARILDEWNPSTLFNYQDNAAVFLHQDEQLAEFQFNGKPWEAFNSFNLSG